MSSGREVGFEYAEDLAGDVAFNAAHHVFLGQSFGHAAGDVVLGSLVVPHPAHADEAEGAVGLPCLSPPRCSRIL